MLVPWIRCHKLPCFHPNTQDIEANPSNVPSRRKETCKTSFALIYFIWSEWHAHEFDNIRLQKLTMQTQWVGNDLKKSQIILKCPKSPFKKCTLDYNAENWQNNLNRFVKIRISKIFIQINVCWICWESRATTLEFQQGTTAWKPLPLTEALRGLHNVYS